jgi:hypothetical protein
MRVLHNIYAFNRGLVSALALARIDLKRMAWSAETMVNWMVRALGAMYLRPGLGYIASTRSNAQAIYLPFVFATDDTALVELTNLTMRVLIDDVVVTRPAITATFFRWNGAAFVTSSDTTSTFVDATDAGYWKDNDEAGGTSAFATGGYLSLIGNGTASAIRDRKVDMTPAETGTEHTISIVVNRGNVVLRVGSTEGGDEYLTDRTLRPGYHSIAVTPAADFFIRLSNYRDIATLVDSVTIVQAAADMTLTTPWLLADLPNIRLTQSGDVIFLACKGYSQKRIERIGGASNPRSWSVVEYLSDDGPFGDINTGPVRLKGSALTGDITLTAERAFFKATHVGALFALTSAGQEVSVNILAEDTWSDPIRVTGITTSRSFSITIEGPTFTGTTTVRVRRSVATPGDWTEVSGLSWTAVLATTPHVDGLDNQIIYYQIGVKTGEFTALDDITATLTFSAGSITGRVRVTGYTSTTVVTASVLSPLGKADQYTADWREGDWSPRKGYPSAVELENGRLSWFGKGYHWGSVSDQFDSFDDEVEGDSGPLRRTIGKGPVDTASWALAGVNLLMGLQGSVLAVRSSSLDEPLTQAKYNLKPVSGVGTAAIQGILVDSSAVFVGRNGTRVYEAAFDAGSLGYAAPADLTAIVPEIGEPGFVRMAVQRSLDTRIHFVRSDGTVAILVFDKLENVTCWLEIETDGEIEDVVVLPGLPASPMEDRVYYAVKRTIDGSTVRYLEKWALESQVRGLADTRLADSHIVKTAGLGSRTVTDFDHLIGEEVVVWIDGVCPRDDNNDPKRYTVNGSGNIVLDDDDPVPASFFCAGLPYRARWKSAKLMTMGEQMPLGKLKRIGKLTLVAAYMHHEGLTYGQDFDHLDALPAVEEGAVVAADTVWTSYTYDAFELNGVYDEDARLCLEANSPRPATILAVAIE